MRMIALTGLAAQAKCDLAHALVTELQAMSQRAAVIDNGEKPFHFPDIPIQRLRGGCVCCSLAGGLLPAVQQTEADGLILIVSAQADPEALARVLKAAPFPTYTIAVLTAHTPAYLGARLHQFADEVVLGG